MFVSMRSIHEREGFRALARCFTCERKKRGEGEVNVTCLALNSVLLVGAHMNRLHATLSAEGKKKQHLYPE
jgi:hypothetical protein